MVRHEAAQSPGEARHRERRGAGGARWSACARRAACGGYRWAVSVAAVLALIGALAAPLGAQSLYDPDDVLYRHLAVWEQRGYLAPLPLLRPYPPQLVMELLRQVTAAGDPRARAVAAGYLAALAPRPRAGVLDAIPPFEVTAYGGIALQAGHEQIASGVALGTGLESTALGPALFGYSAGIRYWWESIRQPLLHHDPQPAYMFDNVGPNFEPFEARADLRGLAAFGTPRLHVHASFAQRAFGSALHDSVVLGAGAPPAAQLALVYAGERLIYTVAFLDLLAQYGVNSRTASQLYSLKNALPPTSRFPSKYLMMHALQWHPLRWLDLDIFTTTLFGGRLSLYSLLPTAFLTEPYNLNYDNVFGGIRARVRLPFDLSLAATLYVDDYQLFEGKTFNPNPLANKTAGLAALAWTPDQVPGVLSLDYLFVAPYTYTHSRHQPIDYLTYTHRAQPLGSRLPPNSDQWTLAVLITPLPGLDLEARARAIRHGNASDHANGPEDLPGELEGTVWDDGYNENGRVTFFGPATFLTQAVLEQVYQFELAVTGRLLFDRVPVTGRVSYGVEYIRNRDLVSGATATNHTFGIELETRL